MGLIICEEDETGNVNCYESTRFKKARLDDLVCMDNPDWCYQHD